MAAYWEHFKNIVARMLVRLDLTPPSVAVIMGISVIVIVVTRRRGRIGGGHDTAGKERRQAAAEHEACPSAAERRRARRGETRLPISRFEARGRRKARHGGGRLANRHCFSPPQRSSTGGLGSLHLREALTKASMNIRSDQRNATVSFRFCHNPAIDLIWRGYLVSVRPGVASASMIRGRGSAFRGSCRRSRRPARERPRDSCCRPWPRGSARWRRAPSSSRR